MRAGCVGENDGINVQGPGRKDLEKESTLSWRNRVQEAANAPGGPSLSVKNKQALDSFQQDGMPGLARGNRDPNPVMED